MGNIFSKLPSFASDYSGAAGVFYDMDGICITCDAGSCAGCYLILDEPRLFNETKKIFSVNLRERDVVLGADKRLKKEIKETYDEFGGKCVSFLGTPVPTIIGMDFKGLALEIEKEIGIPVFGIDTNGLDFYDVGQLKSYKKLLDYCMRTKGTVTGDVNVIGASPLDMWDLNQIRNIITFLKASGAKNPIVWGANGKLEEIAGASEAKLNIAVSNSAIPIVKKMYQEFKIPYLIGYPIGKKQTMKYGNQVKNIFNGKSMEIKSQNPTNNRKRILIIGEQIASNSLREMFREEYGYVTIDVVSYFQMYDECREENDKKLILETDLTEYLVKNEKYDVIVGDPLYFSLLPYKPKKLIALPHIAVSSRAFWDKSPNIFGEKGSLYFDEILNRED